MKPFVASGSSMRSDDDRHHHLVRHELAARHDVLGAQPDQRAGLDRRAQHVAGRELHDAVLLDEPLRLRALPAPGGPSRISLIYAAPAASTA